ncbi:MAG: hypothetical protein IKO44_03140 [Ruminococcus sp.]|nr:hypothetical protein [Ruminococcus sp.]
MANERTEKRKLLACELLKRAFAEKGRLPKRSDFSPAQVCFIKQVLGPFPRALEAAGLKPVTKIPAAEKSRIKRLRAKQRRRLLKATILVQEEKK